MDQFAVRIPESTIAREATELVQEISQPFLYNHCLRTFVFGDLLGQSANLKYDRELLYLGSLLHDLGLTERFSDGESFEVEGSNVAYAFLIEHGLPLGKAAVVREAIALHLSILAEQKPPEIALVRVGAGLDVVGRGIGILSPGTLDQVLAAYPRLDLKKALLAVCRSQAERKPTSTVARLFQQGFAESVAHAPFGE